ncbi:glycosyltransferase family 9 protein [Crenothrix sp.]|uniref:glycosyltransferase family 9 protein n=1 Tax=Crenothrix sp. TaxID=3100433 RepID=UPI00374C92DD
MRYLGDVLLVTPLLRSLRIAYPSAQLDVLVYDNTAAILEGNTDVDNIIITPLRIGYRQYMALLKRIFRRYDLAVVTQTGDRPFLYGLMAASFRIAVVPPKGATGWWKRLLLQRWTEFDNEQSHTVLQNLKLLDLIGVPKDFTLVAPQTDNAESLTRFEFLSDDYVVLHPFPQWKYKRWTVEGWVEIGCYLRDQGFKVVLSGGGLQEELDYVAAIAQQLPVDTVNLAGQTSLAQLAHILARAKLYIGPDTGITHLATATAVPVIALYGPTNPIKWSPWPYFFAQDKNPFSSIGSQKVNNVSLIQGKADCVPCQMEGCERHRQSYSRCLDTLTVEQVKSFIKPLLRI